MIVTGKYFIAVFNGDFAGQQVLPVDVPCELMIGGIDLQ